VLAGGAEGDLQGLIKRKFTKMVTVSPPASRAASSEKVVVATGFRGWLRRRARRVRGHW